MTPNLACDCPRARHTHGTRACYDTCGCRCIHCRVAYDADVLASRHGNVKDYATPLIPRDGTRRRLEALHAIGWSGGQLAECLGITFNGVFDIRCSPSGIFPTQAQTIADLYDQLWNVTPPDNGSRKKTLNWAKRMGFKPPMWWDDDEIDHPDATERHTRCTPADTVDDIKVHRALGGDTTEPLNAAERLETVRILTDRGYSAQDIADKIGVTQRTVTRSRAALRRATAGDIGDNPREYEFEPLTAPGVPEPVTVPAEPTRAPEPVKVPA